jgi:folate-binding Fe-S cluster repair protein YgfZ
VGIVVCHARLAKIDEELRDGVPGNASHPRDGAKAISFHKGCYDPDSFLLR